MRMMTMCSGILAVATVMTSGCAKPRPSADTVPPFERLQERANAMITAGGLAAVGIGTSRTVHLALENAKLSGRRELMLALQMNVDALQRDFIAEIGEDGKSEFEAFFTAVGSSVAAHALRVTVPLELLHETAEDGMTTAWALMVQDPKLIADALATQADTFRHQSNRFSASRAFENLTAQIRQFEDFKKRHSLDR